jgi:regulator of nonsense transcripts 1
MDTFSHLGGQREIEDDLESVTSSVLYQGRTNDRDDAATETLSLMSGRDEEDDLVPFQDLPEHACSYCGIHSPSSVVKCVTCNKWFCNSRGNSSSSHIVTHLVRARHKV